MKRKHKYGAKRTFHDGIWFDSKREAMRYAELKLLEKAGKIQNLRRQVSYHLVIETTYVADFVYIENNQLVVEDSKGHRTREYLQKRKAMRKQHGIEIRET
jgi:heat shock protein HspQ